ncbi:MAG: hypothetical protein IPJ34_28915 [Myxococcales bacterium]|nr:hypothetical protein [Myxococcales bacterium]
MALDTPPPRNTTIAIGGLVIATIVFSLARGPRREATAAPSASPVALDSTLPSFGPSPADRLSSAIADLRAMPSLSISPPQIEKLQAALDGVAKSDKGLRMPDGKDPPPLPVGSPHWIRFGVILVRYEGAQFAPKEAPPRDVAELRAKALHADAQKDFAAAVKAGDPGSMADIGSVKRGVLEPATQYMLFTLPVGSLSPILDTPRGFWIAKRLQ